MTKVSVQCPECEGDGFLEIPCEDCQGMGVDDDGRTCEFCDFGYVEETCEICEGVGMVVQK